MLPAGADRKRAHEHEPRVLLQEAPAEQVHLDVRDPQLRGQQREATLVHVLADVCKGEYVLSEDNGQMMRREDGDWYLPGTALLGNIYDAYVSGQSGVLASIFLVLLKSWRRLAAFGGDLER